MKNENLCPMDEQITVDLEGYLQEDGETTYYALDGEEADDNGQAE